MQNQEYEHAYYSAPPSELPRDGWQRQEIHDMRAVFVLGTQLDAEMRALGYPRKDTFAVNLGLREAAGNAIRHGNRGDKNRNVLIGYHVSKNEVLLEIADEGFGFDPYSVSEPLSTGKPGERLKGCGLFLMKVYMTWIRFNRRGNRVLLCKRRSV